MHCTFLLCDVKLRVESTFKVNEYITLKLEDNKTNIYVRGGFFLQCKYLLLNIKVGEVQFFNEIKSIDEAVEMLDKSQERSNKVNIPPEVEFWGHCSNLQAWYENNYDTRLLHSNLSIPLLKKLTEVGDPKAKEVFREEILRVLDMGVDNVIIFLLENKYLKHFTEDELLIVYKDTLPKFRSSKLLLPYLHAFSSQGLPIAHRHYKRQVKELLLTSDFQEIVKIIRKFGKYLLEEDCIFLFDKLRSMVADDSERIDKFEDLDRLIYELQEQYGVNFKISYKIATLLREEEQKIVYNILLNSLYPYLKLDFQADEVRRRLWREELYYEFLQ